MIPPYLDKLLQEGKAAFKTFQAGGSQKSVLKVGPDRYIIIIGFTHFPYIPQDNTQSPNIIEAAKVTQMRISSSKSDNLFVIRNDIYISLFFGGIAFDNYWNTGQPYQEDCLHLVHEDSVSIAFSLGTALTPTVSAATPHDSSAKKQPLGYGKEGQTGGGLAVGLNIATAVNEFKPQGQFTRATPGINSHDEVAFDVIPGTTDLVLPNPTLAYQYPLCLIKYVEIKGNPTDVQPSN